MFRGALGRMFRGALGRCLGGHWVYVYVGLRGHWVDV